MLTRKLYNIKLILRIIISCFVIVGFVRSCAKAYTLDEFYDFCDTVTQLDIASSDQIASANWVRNNLATIKSKISTYANMNSWVVWKAQSSQYGVFYRIMGYENGNFRGWNYSSSTGLINNTTSSAKISYITNGSYWANDGTSMTFQFCLLNESMAQNVDFTGKIGNNYYSNNNLTYGDLFSEDYTYNGNTVEAIKTTYNYTITFIENVLNYSEQPLNIILKDSVTNQEYTNTFDFVTGKNTNSNFEFADLRRLWNNQNLYKAY